MRMMNLIAQGLGSQIFHHLTSMQKGESDYCYLPQSLSLNTYDTFFALLASKIPAPF